MNFKSNDQKGVSLVESLIALTILLFIMFTVFVLLGSLISKGYTLNKKASDSHNIRNAIEEYKDTGILDENIFNKNFIDNPNNENEYVIKIYNNVNDSNYKNSDDSTSQTFISRKPIATINLKSCVDLDCTFNGIGSSDGGKYIYSSGGKAVFSADGGVNFNDNGTMLSAEQDIVIRYDNSGQYTVSLVVEDKYGKESDASTKNIQLTSKPYASLNVIKCIKQQCTFNAENSMVYVAGNVTYKYSFPGTDLPDIITNNAHENISVFYNGKQDPNDINAYFTSSSDNFDVNLELVDSVGKTDTDKKSVNIVAQYITSYISNMSIDESGNIYGDVDLPYYANNNNNPFVYDVNDYHISFFQVNDKPETYMTTPDWGNVSFQNKVTGTVGKNIDPANGRRLLYSHGRDTVASDAGWYGYCVSGLGFTMNCGYSTVNMKPSFTIGNRVQYKEGGNTYFGLDIYNLSKWGTVNYMKLVYREPNLEVVVYEKTGTVADYGNSTFLTGKLQSQLPDYSSLKPVAVVPDWYSKSANLCLILGTDLGGKSDEVCVPVQASKTNITPWLSFDITNVSAFYNGGYNPQIMIEVDPGTSMTPNYWYMKEHDMHLNIPNSSYKQLWSYGNEYGNGTTYRTKVLSEEFGYNKETGVNNKKTYEADLVLGTYRLETMGYNTQGALRSYIDITVTSLNPFMYTLGSLQQHAYT